MLPMKKFFFVLTVAIVSGCASVKTVSVKVTEPRPAIPVKDVQLMLSVPTNAVLAAYIYADSCCSSGRGADAAQAQLKEKAAAIGANALVIRTWEPTIDFSPRTATSVLKPTRSSSNKNSHNCCREYTAFRSALDRNSRFTLLCHPHCDNGGLDVNGAGLSLTNTHILVKHRAGDGQCLKGVKPVRDKCPESRFDILSVHSLCTVILLST